MSGNDIDPESLKLVLQLQLQDMESLIKGKFRKDEKPDTELALEIYKAELESLACCVSDRTISRSIAQAVELDGPVIRAHAEVEQQAVHDRNQALSLGAPGGAQSIAPQEARALDDEFLSKLKALYVDEDMSPATGESSSWAAKREKYRNCMACNAKVPFFDIARCPLMSPYFLLAAADSRSLLF
ncbi:hypothetical protein QQZ08_006763 [Neonectria magnoliae]|uniref:Uncharacterized protein n=1 Tax=Neonectria magnoliae TaxID=2732573 RepID=A0ABR1I188_9HYPO